MIELIKIRSSSYEESDLIEFIQNNTDDSFVRVPRSPKDLERLIFFWAKTQNSSIGLKRVGCISYSVESGHLVEIQKSVVAKDLRGNGFGRDMNLALEHHLIDLGFGKMRSVVYSHNLVMLNLRLKQGFIIEGFHRNNERPGIHEYTLGKEIG